MSIDHNYTDEVVCPHCGYQHSDSGEFFWDTIEPIIECAKCGREFTATQEFTVTYSTEKNSTTADQSGKGGK
jgi:DNA-directed RNA polymerase subunit RPC12/RpoP